MNKALIIPLIVLCFLLIDLYVYEGIQTAFQSFSIAVQRSVLWIYWGITLITIAAFLTYHLGNPYFFGRHFSTIILLGIFTNYISKTFLLVFVLADDVQRLFRWTYAKISQLFTTPMEAGSGEDAINRSEFLAKAGVIAASVPVIAIGWGIVSGAHDYRVRRQTIHLKNLPRSLDGIRIGQLSDIHSGSFWNKTAVKGGVELLMREKTDLVFFTGDLVNNRADEMEEYIRIFGQVKAPLGVYSIFGNHDYGDYVDWSSRQAKVQNLRNLTKVHELLGWNLLRNESRIIGKGNEQLAILGVENWSAKGRFPKYGQLAATHNSVAEVPFKLLLSHDPSHWKAEVLPGYPDVAVTFSGHTHGMQFGVEIKNIKWSPVQYMYEEWAGLYKAGEQYLYVNRGFGFLGYPGRIGIPPELTVLELKCG